MQSDAEWREAEWREAELSVAERELIRINNEMINEAPTRDFPMLRHCENIILQLQDLLNSELQGIDAIKDKIQHLLNEVTQLYNITLSIIRQNGGRRKSHRRNRKSHRKTRSRTRQIR